MNRLAFIVKPAFLLQLSMLSACLGGRYQAPIDDQGETQAAHEPIITQSTGDPVGRGAIIDRTGGSAAAGRAPRSPGSAVGSSQATAQTNPEPSLDSGSGSALAGPSHQVLSGETLYSIAFQYDMDARALALANGLNPPYTIYANQRLNLDLSRVNASASALSNPVLNTVGTVVNNNSVARAQGVNPRSGGVSRQPIAASGSQNPEPSWSWPLEGQLINNFQSGSRGLDIAASQGAPVYATGSGEVVYSGRGIQGMGDLIIIRHSDRFLSAYGHNSVMLVAEGSSVQSGQKIAEVGVDDDGVPLLHFEIRVDGKPVDPLAYLPR